MGEVVRVRGIYEDGVIRLEEPDARLEGMRFALQLLLPEGGALVDGVGRPVPDHLAIRVGERLQRFIAGADGPLKHIVREFRTRLERASGVSLPPVLLQVDPEMDRNGYAIDFHGQTLAEGLVESSGLLMIADDKGDADRLLGFEGARTTDPVFGLPALWVDTKDAKAARATGLTVVDGPAVIGAHLEEMVAGDPARFWTLAAVREWLTRAARELDGAMVHEAVPGTLSELELHRVLGELLAAKRNIHDADTILRIINDWDGVDLEDLCTQIQAALPPVAPI